jgi:WD40 repeat protein
MGSDGSIRVYELSSNAIDNVFVLPAFRSSDVEQPLVAWSADDQTLAASASINDGIQFWDLTTRQLVQTFATEIETSELAFAKQRGHFVAGNARGDILVLDKAGTLTHTFSLWDGQIPTGLACSADGRWLAVTSAEGGLAIIDSSNWEILRQTQLHRPLSSVSWCSADNHLVVGTEDGDVIKFNFALENVAAAQLDAGNVVSLAWDQETNKLAVGSESCIVCNPDLEVIEEVSAQYHNGVHRVHWNDGRLLIAALHRGLYLFDTETRENTLLLPPTLRQILSLAWHPSKDLVAVGTMGGTLLLANHQGTVLSMASGEPAMTNTSSLRWSPDGRFLAGASSWGGKQLRIWNEHGEIVRAIEAELGCLACDWSADGQYLAAGGEDDTLTIYRAIDGSVATKIDLGTIVRTIDCHPTEPVVAVGTENGCHLLRLTTIAGDTSSLNDAAAIEPTALWEKGRSLRAIAFSPQGDRLAIAETHGTISILRYPSEHLVQRRTVDWWVTQELKWNHRGTQIACGNLGILDANALHTLSLPNSSRGYDYAWSLEDTIVISGDWIENLACFDARNFQPIWQSTIGKDGGTVTLDNQGRLLDQHGPRVDLLLLTPNPAGGFDTSPLSVSQE